MTNPYDAAGTGRRMSTWIPSSAGPRQSSEIGLQSLRNRSRDAVRNDPVAAAIIRHWVSGLVGSGITPRTSSDDPEAKARIESLWRAWVPFAESGGESFDSLQALACRALIESGECFVRVRSRRLSDGLPVPVQFEVLEADMLPMLTRLHDGQNRIIQGIEIDAIGRRVAYWFHREHPGDSSSIGFDESRLVRVSAEAVSHVFTPARPGQLRGVPLMSTILAKLRSVGNFDDAVLHRQELANLFAGFIERAPSVTDPALDPLTGQPMQFGPDGAPLAALEPGIMQELLPGESVKFSDPPDAGTNYVDFIRAQFQAIAAGAGLPYEILTGDLRDVSDRTLRVSLNQWLRQVEAIQWQTIIPKVCAFVRNAWADAALIAGALDDKTAALAKACEWTPPRHRHLHPTQDVQALRMEVEAGFRSRASVVAEYGFDVADVDRERADDAERERALGIQSDSARLAEAEAAKLEAEAEAAKHAAEQAVRAAEASKAAAAEARAKAIKLATEHEILKLTKPLAVDEARAKAKTAQLELEAAKIGLEELRAE